MKVLFTSPVLEYPPAGGPQLRVDTSIMALNRVSQLHIISRVDSASLGGAVALEHFRSHCQKYICLPSVSGLSRHRFIRRAQKVLRKLFMKSDSDFIVDYAEKNCIDVIWFGHGQVSYKLIKEIKKKRPSLKVVCDTDSVWSRFVLRELPYETDPDRRKQIKMAGTLKQMEENDWVNVCDVTTAVSQVDAEYYRNIATNPHKIHLFSNVINIDTYQHPPPPPAGLKKPSIYLAGTFGHYHSPMDRAARWVIEEVLPLVRKVVPHVNFYIVGRSSDVCFGNLNDPNITATGRLDSVLPYLCNIDVALVPLSFESGTRFKILEGGACNIPIVSTTLGAEGLPVVDGEHILIADEPNAFAQAIIKLLNDKKYGDQLARNCYNLVSEHYSVKALACEAENILHYLEQH